MKLGIYQSNDLLGNAALTSLEYIYGAEISILSFYRAWNRCAIGDDLSWLHDVLSSPKDILLTWEPWLIPSEPKKPENQPDFSLNRIISGRYDSYIRAFASTLAHFKKTILLRPMHEMNGFWYPWCGTVNGNSPNEFRHAWSHLRRLFAEEGASNVRWVWSPYTSSFPDTEDNSICSYFPGDGEIDVIALDGYNWGTSTEWGVWQSFVDLFKNGYTTITALTDKTVIIAETGCTELGGNKAEWIREMFSTLPSHFERINAIIWFDVNKECDWRIASTTSALHAFSKSAQNL